MKKVILYLFPIIALVGIFLVYQKLNEDPMQIINEDLQPLEVKDNTVQCPQCYMYLVGKQYTAQAINAEKKTTFFDDVGCLILWIEENHKDEDIVQWVYTLDTHKWVYAQNAFYSTDDTKTPMEYGFAAYENNKDGFIDYDEMRLRMLRGETLLNAKIRKKVLQ